MTCISSSVWGRLARLPFLLFVLLGLLSAANVSFAAPQRLLGTHHMVTLPWAGGATEYQDRFDEEARRWKAAGQDFVILHMDAYDRAYPAQLKAYYDACAKAGVKASASWAWFDRHSSKGDQAARWIPQIVRDTKNHPAQWKIDGVPVYSAFNLPSYSKEVLQDAGLWPVKIWAHTYYYMKNVGQLHWSSDANVIRNTYDVLPWLAGLCNFAGDMSSSQITSLNTLLHNVGRERGKYTMAGVNPFYGSHHLWENQYRGLDEQWTGILKDKPNAVWWVTSNDWRELSYISDLPEAPVWDDHWNRGQMPPLLDHSGYRKFAEPYLAAYKAGKTTPSFSKDRMFLAYQLHPKWAAPVAGSTEGIFGGRLWRSALTDRIYASVHLTAPARIRINGQTSQEFPAGAAHFSIPLEVGSAPEVAIVRNGSVVKSGQGPLPITNSVKTGAWNYLAVEVAADSSSGTPPPIADEDTDDSPDDDSDDDTNNGGVPAGNLSSADIGSPALGGSTALDNGAYTIKAAGSDIWGNRDQFRFVNRQIKGDTELVVRVSALSQTDVWAKAGLMLRSSADASAAHVSLLVTPGNGVRLQWRNSAWSQSATSNGASSGAPRWLKLVRSGNTFTGYSSSNGSSWTKVHSVNISLPATALGGLAVTSHNTGSRTTATFTNFTIGGASTSTPSDNTDNSPPPENPAPTPDPEPTPDPTPGGNNNGGAPAGNLSSADIGSPALGGSTTLNGGAYTIKAAGSDIWSNQDQFRFVSQQVKGNTELVVRVTALSQTDVWAKAGLMLRGSSAASAAHVSLLVTPGNGVRLQWRNSAWSQSATSDGSSGSAPVWLKLVRSGNTFTGYRSSNGSAWTKVHAVSVSLPETALGGLAATSHNTGSRTTATFTNFSISGASPSNGDSGGSG
ncbi:MAG: endo-1,3-alpha-glucanase family glycosylhydrolase, partial [Opitutaceae bacterium]